MYCRKDFDFEDSDVVKVVKRAASEVPLISDDEDLLADEPGSAPDEDEGSGTLEPPIVKPSVPGYPGKELCASSASLGTTKILKCTHIHARGHAS